MEIASLLLVAAIALLLPLTDLPATKRLRVDPSEWRRLRFYRSSIVVLWVFAILSCLAAGSGILQVPRGGEARWIFGGPVRFWSAAVLAAIYFGLALAPGAVCLAKPARRAAYTRAMKSLAFLLPASRREWRWFALLALSAGVCEELIFRGFLLGALRWELGMGLTLAWVVSSLIFGWNHLYQGPAGILRSAIAGLALGLVAIVTGGLLLPMVLHCAADLQILVTFRPGLTPLKKAGAEPVPADFVVRDAMREDTRVHADERAVV